MWGICGAASLGAWRWELEPKAWLAFQDMSLHKAQVFFWTVNAEQCYPGGAAPG